MAKPRRTRIRLLVAERSELERRAAARTASQQDAYRAQIILLAAVWLWRHRFAQHRLDGLKDRPKCPPFTIQRWFSIAFVTNSLPCTGSIIRS